MAGPDTGNFTSLKDIQEWSAEFFVPKFIDNLELILRYGYKDITQSLQNIDLPMLCKLQKALCEKVSSMFHLYKDSRPVNRQVKHRVIPDIYQLSYSIVHDTPSKDLDKVFVSKDAVNIVSTDDIQELIQVTTQLNKKVAELEITVQVLRNELSELQGDPIKSTTCTHISTDTQTESVVPTPSSPISVSIQSPSDAPAEVNSESSGCKEENDGYPFVLPRQHKKRLSKRKRRARKRVLRESKQLSAAEPASTAHSAADDVQQVTSLTTSTCSASVTQATPPLSTLTAAPTSHLTQEVYIGGVHGRHGVSDVESFLRQKGVTCSSCRILSTRQDWRSFVVSVAKSDATIVLDKSLWPADVIVRPFRAAGGDHGPRYHGRHKYASSYTQQGYAKDKRRSYHQRGPSRDADKYANHQYQSNSHRQNNDQWQRSNRWQNGSQRYSDGW